MPEPLEFLFEGSAEGRVRGIKDEIFRSLRGIREQAGGLLGSQKAAFRLEALLRHCELAYEKLDTIVKMDRTEWSDSSIGSQSTVRFVPKARAVQPD